MTRFTRVLLAAALAAVLVAPMVQAQAVDVKERAELVVALASAKLSLNRGLTASRSRGQPVSGKYEVENGKLQLSVYVEKGHRFSEIIVDHATGKISKAERIHEGADLTAALG
jgi:hypothetical protein